VCALDGARGVSKWHTVKLALEGSVLGEARGRRIPTAELLKFEGPGSCDLN
jgi:hypothetical protein